MIFRTLGMACILLIALSLTIGCGGKEKAKNTSKAPKTAVESSNATTTHDHSTSTTTSHSSSGGTMDAVFTSSILYSCPMHPEVVSEQSDANCPLCNMALPAMDGAKYLALQASNPKGCPMCPIVVEGDSPTANCPVCKMELKDIDDHRGHNH